MNDQDKEIACQDCGQTFVFTQAEAKLYQKRGLSIPPKRCKACRAARPRSVQGSGPVRYATGDPNEYRSPMPCEMPAVRYPARGPRSWPESAAPQRTRPTGDEQPPAPSDTAPSEQAQPPQRPRRRPRRMLYSAVCVQCGATTHVPFEPSKGREVMCRLCFREKRGGLPPSSLPGED